MLTREHEREMDRIIERMAEPEYLRKLRKQADQIKAQRDREWEEQRYRSEAERLRREIRAAGHKPVCCVRA